MKITPTRLCSVLLLALSPLAACGGDSEGTVKDPVTLDQIPAQEELDATAAEEIDEENADAAFEDLVDEIEGDE